MSSTQLTDQQWLQIRAEHDNRFALVRIAKLARTTLNADGSVNPSVDLNSILSQILNIATSGTEGDKP